MIFERYEQVYTYDQDELTYGFSIVNGQSHPWLYGDSGDWKLPGLKPYEVNGAMIERLMYDIEIDFQHYDATDPLHEYYKTAFKKLLSGEDTDWKIVLVRIQPGELYFQLKNTRIESAQELLRGQDMLGKASISFDGDAISSEVVIVCSPYEHMGLQIQLFCERSDIKGEIDFYNISCYDDNATVQECHQISSEKRRTRLYFEEETETDENEDSSIPEAMFGEIEVLR